MIYFLTGGNSYSAINKINEFKDAFRKKNENFLIEEADGEADEISEARFFSMLGQGNLFAKKRLIVFKDVFKGNDGLYLIFEKCAEQMRASADIFVFWEKKPEKEISAKLKKYSEKVQEVEALTEPQLDKWLDKKANGLGLSFDKNERAIMIEEAGESAEWALENILEKILLESREISSLAPSVSLALNPLSGGSDARTRSGRRSPNSEISHDSAQSPFVFVEKMFGPRALFAVKELAASGQDIQRFIYVLLWKLKQRKMTHAYFEGIKAESQMRRDPKNAEEILERFVSALNK